MKKDDTSNIYAILDSRCKVYNIEKDTVMPVSLSDKELNTNDYKKIIKFSVNIKNKLREAMGLKKLRNE